MVGRQGIPTTYAEANAILRGRDSRVIANNTRLERGAYPHDHATGRDISLRLHSTDVVTWHADGAITLNSGGYHTVTTKDRMNRALSGARVYSERGVWYVAIMGEWATPYVFADGLTIRGVTISGAGPTPDRTLQRSARQYARDYVAALQKGDVHAPDGGDCWYCFMTTEDGRTMGDIAKSDHVLAHVRESYYVPSLALRAMATFGASDVCRWYVQAKMTGGEAPYGDDIARHQLTRMIRRYVLRNLGFAA